MIESCRQKGDEERRVYLSPEDEKIKNFLDLQSPKSKTEIQWLCGMAAQLKSWVPRLQLIYPNIQRLTANNVLFTCSPDLEKEFQDVKKAIHEAVKKLYAFVDSAMTVGTAYILA